MKLFLLLSGLSIAARALYLVELSNSLIRGYFMLSIHVLDFCLSVRSQQCELRNE